MALMLAVSSKSIAASPDMVVAALGRRGGYSFEIKQDGIRAVVSVGEHVKIKSRQNVNLTDQYPDVVEALTGSAASCVLDGELVALDGSGRPNFQLLQKGHQPVQFSAFDVLELDAVSQRMQPYSARRSMLEELAADLPGMLLFPVSPDGKMMWRFVLTNRLEGLIAKRVDSRYSGTRSPDWIKIKLLNRINAIVIGKESGKGDRASTFGALNLALIGEDGSLERVGKVGSGFTDRDLRVINELMEDPHREITVEVEHLGLSASMRLRSPVFKRISDAPSVNCTTEQLNAD